MTMRTFALPLSLESLQWLEDWTPPNAANLDGAPLSIAEKIVIAVARAQIFDAREKARAINATPVADDQGLGL